MYHLQGFFVGLPFAVVVVFGSVFVATMVLGSVLTPPEGFRLATETKKFNEGYTTHKNRKSLFNGDRKLQQQSKFQFYVLFFSV